MKKLLETARYISLFCWIVFAVWWIYLEIIIDAPISETGVPFFGILISCFVFTLFVQLPNIIQKEAKE
uniref:Uncharacterized protein n=1 Tax=viral metagenome TaxID=1070528 RepID=A0A6H1ZYU0_9ZZZZ